MTSRLQSFADRSPMARAAPLNEPAAAGVSQICCGEPPVPSAASQNTLFAAVLAVSGAKAPNPPCRGSATALSGSVKRAASGEKLLHHNLPAAGHVLGKRPPGAWPLQTMNV